MKPITYVLLLCATLLSSCDDGRIAEEDFNLEEEGRVAKVEVKLEGQKHGRLAIQSPLPASLTKVRMQK